VEVDRADDLVGQVRFELAQLRPGEHRVIDPVFVETPRIGDGLAQTFLGAQASDPALVPD